ncbi:hypothetical protein N431DRAFT_477201 [Stipitochalara longipes BDJ]|nr:hypothetical protein N431DRAFT_477201 [Stipitochalara longipes BDJ]
MSLVSSVAASGDTAQDNSTVPVIESRSVRRLSETTRFQEDHADTLANDDLRSLDLEDKVIQQEYPQLGDIRTMAGNRATQAILYTKLVETRLTFLETELQRLKGNDGAAIHGQCSHVSDSNTILAIKRMSWAEFKIDPTINTSGAISGNHVPEVDMRPKYVLEVLTEEGPGIRRTRKRQEASAKPLRSGDKQSGNDGRGTESVTQMTSSGTATSLPVPERLRIRSKELLEILEEIAGVTFHSSPWGKEKIVFLRPFKLLVTFESEIRERLEQLETTSRVHPTPPSHDTESHGALEHLRLLVEFMDIDLKPLFEIRRRIQGGAIRKIAFADLWHLFKHGQLLVTAEKLQLYRVIKFTGGRERLSPVIDSSSNQDYSDIRANASGAFLVECCYFDFNGVQYGPARKTFVIRKYEGEKEVLALSIYPLTLDPTSDLLRVKLIHRGKHFLHLSRPNSVVSMYYSGLTLDLPQEEIDSQIIIDPQLAFAKKPALRPVIGIGTLVDHDWRETYEEHRLSEGCTIDGCCSKDIIHDDYDIDERESAQFMDRYKHSLISVDVAEELTDEELSLLSFKVYGFVLRTLRWATFNIDLVTKMIYCDSLRDLVLPQGHKQFLLALVANHWVGQSTGQDMIRSTDQDVIRGKGKGLVILLHGQPGVGKTSTAECIAETMRRPLFSITCGDVGVNANEVQQNLEGYFQLAQKWGCILLLDEADVFLQKRDRSDIGRNATVSVFLKLLEYYSGIFFLTTNRVGTFDQAFSSRIHLSLYYPGLDKKATIQIWKIWLRITKERMKERMMLGGRSFKIAEHEILEFAKSHYRSLQASNLTNWNGRQIRNAFQSAIALAEYEAKGNDGSQGDVILNRKHFESVAESSQAFDHYLTETLGRKDADIARMEQIRSDNFSLDLVKERTARKPNPPSKKKHYSDSDEESSVISDDE